MSSVRTLESTLTRALTVAFEPPSVPRLLVQEIEILQQRLGGDGAARPSDDYLRNAVAHFRRTAELPDLRSTRAVCFGAAYAFEGAVPIIEEHNLFPRLLDGADRYREEPRRFRRCYAGLLHSYFRYDPDNEAAPPAGRQNWRWLRDYLHERRLKIRADGVPKEWAETILEHPNLLTDAPVDRYGPDLLGGRTEVVDQLRSRLEISDDGWLMRRLVLAHIMAATREPDAQFHHRVESLLALLKGHVVLEDEGLTLILDRYSKISAPELHASLRDRSVECWGNPWLERNTPKWSRVKTEARSLITTWLKLDLIHQFFEVLADDRGTDKRRVKFWMKYHESIHDMYFALGANVLYSRAADVRSLRTKMGDHLLTLTGAGSPKNNAFVMLMGDLVVVEFGAKGNACFVFKRSAIPFELRGSVRGDSSELKHQNHEERLLHMDGSSNWETKFEETLSAYGIRPSASARVMRAAQRPQTTMEGAPVRATVQPSPVRPAPPRDSAVPLTRHAVEDLCKRYRIDHMDHSGVGGNFWVFHNYNTGVVVDQLKAWGFKFTDKRGGAWWIKGPL